MVLAAARSEDTVPPELEQLCRVYWYPLYAHIRGRGYNHEDAEDLTQGFLLQLVQHHAFAHIDARKGRFRSFLLASLGYYLADERDRARARKRGGGQPVLSFEAQDAQRRFRLEPIDDRSPTKLFDRRWALALLEHVLTRLRQEFESAGKGSAFGHLEPFLVRGAQETSYAQLAAELRVSREAARKSVHRMRVRYYQLFREEVARTVSSPSEIDDEMRYLSAALAG